MLQNKYFYIITRDKQIFEIPYTTERISAAVKSMRDKGLFTIEGMGIVLNGVDVSKVLNEEQYKNYLATVRPAEHVAHGVWYNRRGEFIRFEAWKQELRDKQKKIATPDVLEETPEQKERVLAKGREFLSKLRAGKL